jgi:hypothetical protein
MSVPRRFACTAVLLLGSSGAMAASPPPASAFNPVKPVCSAAGWFSGFVGKACSAVQNSGRFLDAGKKLLGGHVGSAVKTAFGGGGVASKATAALTLTAIVGASLAGARFALHETGRILSSTTAPQLQSTWFSSMYWRVAGIAAVLTLPFLFAAAVQALLHSDITLLLRAAFGYLPLAMLAVGIAAPLAMLLLAASDQLSAVVSSAAGDASGRFLTRASIGIGTVSVFGSPFVALFVGLIAIVGGLVLWIELLVRAAAVYVVVLMLPLAFAALVWPARRVWAVRAVELLVALILSKFAIVAVLALGGAALGSSTSHSVSGMLGGVVLLVMGAFAPWALLRLIPLAEIASGAAGALTDGRRSAGAAFQRVDAKAQDGEKWAARTTDMRREAEDVARRVDGAGDAAKGEGQRMRTFHGSRYAGEVENDREPSGTREPSSAPAPAPSPEPSRVSEPSVLQFAHDDPNPVVEFAPLNDEGGRV